VTSSGEYAAYGNLAEREGFELAVRLSDYARRLAAASANVIARGDSVAVLHGQSGLRWIAPNAEKFDNQKPRAASLLFVRRGTQSYDEFIGAVPLSASPQHDVRDDQHVRHFLDWRKRKCMYLVWSQVT
jgi:hypothetical protein